MLSTHQLCVRTAQNKTLISDISVQIQTGKIYGLIGHNGSGKSTLIKALAGETKPSDGQVMVDGKSLLSMSANELAKILAYLPQKLPDATHFSVKELVMLGRYPHQAWLAKPSKADEQIVLQSMQLTGVAQFAEQMVATMSGGERARAWLAMCLAQQTRYLLLDEPLAALDVMYQVEVLRLLRELVAKTGLTVVIILHDINLAAQFCDELIALKQGKICHQGAVSELMTPSILQDIFGISFSLLTHPVTGQQVAVV